MDDDVTLWINQLAEGDDLAAQRIWEQYYERLVRLAHRKLGGTNRRMADEEDVASSAFRSFFRGVEEQRFPRLNDRHDLWKILITICIRKAIAQMRHGHRQKRGGGAVRGESVFINRDAREDAGIHEILGQEPTPQMAALATEQCEVLLNCLEDESLRTVALAKLEGYDNADIAQMLNCVSRTVERKLSRIREIWSLQAEA